MKTALERLLADALAGRLPPLPADDEPRPGEKTVAERKARAAFYRQVYSPANFRPRT
jgi:hypothetical protein